MLSSVQNYDCIVSKANMNMLLVYTFVVDTKADQSGSVSYIFVRGS